MLKDKKAISIMIGYVLLVSIAVVMSVIVYQWLKTYVPSETLECPEGVSLFIEKSCCTTTELNLTLKNNGKFNIDGYFIHATDNPQQELATKDISRFTDAGKGKGGIVLSHIDVDGSEAKYSFNLSEIGQIYSIEITPVRFQDNENKKRLVNCGDSKIRGELNCNAGC